MKDPCNSFINIKRSYDTWLMSLREQLIEFVMNRTLPSAQNFEKDKWASLEDIDVSNLIRTHCSDVTNTNNDKRLHNVKFTWLVTSFYNEKVTQIAMHWCLGKLLYFLDAITSPAPSSPSHSVSHTFRFAHSLASIDMTRSFLSGKSFAPIF